MDSLKDGQLPDEFITRLAQEFGASGGTRIAARSCHCGGQSVAGLASYVESDSSRSSAEPGTTELLRISERDRSRFFSAVRSRKTVLLRRASFRS